MKHFRLALVLLLVAAASMGQARRIRFVSSGSSVGVIAMSDFVDDCVYALPRSVSAIGDAYYSYGLTVRYESSDTGNERHLVSAATSFMPTNQAGDIYEWRDPATCGTPSDAYDVSTYDQISIIKAYGDVYGSKRYYYSDGALTKTAVTDWLNGWQDVAIDPSDNTKLWWQWHEGYATAGAYPECINKSLGYADLNYAAGTATPHGQWGVTGVEVKAMGTGIEFVPAAFATAVFGDATKRLVLGAGGYASKIEVCGGSLGVTTVGVVPPYGVTEDTSITGTVAAGFWGALDGHDMARPTPFLVAGGVATFGSISQDGDHWSWVDHVKGATCIHETRKAGCLYAAEMGMGQANYISSTIAAEFHRYWMLVLSETQLASVVGGANRYSLAPHANSAEMTLSPIDYTVSPYKDESASPVATITTITSPTGGPQAVSPCGGAPDVNGATVTTSGSYTPSDGEYLSIRGTTRESEYGGIWNVETGSQTGTSFRIYNCSGGGGSATWSGTSATGGSVRHAANQVASEIRGIAYDHTSNYLWILLVKQQGVNGLSSQPILIRKRYIGDD